MVEISFANKINYHLIPYNQYGENPNVELLELDAFTLQLNGINEIIADPIRLNEAKLNYYQQCEPYEVSNLEPYSNRIFRKLKSLGLLPKFIKGKKLLTILNHIDCESHRDKLIFALKRKIK